MAAVVKQFCINGHDTFIVGRGQNGQCRVCHIRSSQKWVAKNRTWCRAAYRRTYIRRRQHKLDVVAAYYKRNREARSAQIKEWKRKHARPSDWWAHEAKEAV